MHRKAFYLSTLSLLIIIALVSIACGSNPEKDVIGKWVVVNQDIIEHGKPVDLSEVGREIEFLSDKTYISTFLFNRGGQWTILDDGRIKLDNMGTIKFATIKGNQMTINDPGKSYTVYKLILERKTAK